MHILQEKILHIQLMHNIIKQKMLLKYWVICLLIQSMQNLMLKGKDIQYIENYLRLEKCNLKH